MHWLCSYIATYNFDHILYLYMKSVNSCSPGMYMACIAVADIATLVILPDYSYIRSYVCKFSCCGLKECTIVHACS